MEGLSHDQFVDEFKGWQRRNIENIVTMLRAMANLYGENAIKVASAAYLSLMRQRWMRLAERFENRGIIELFNLLWEESKGIIMYEVKQKDKNLLDLKVSSCFWADEFRRLGAANIGYELCCMADFYIVESFNPEIVYKRSRTIMKGDDCCDHRYRIRE